MVLISRLSNDSFSEPDKNSASLRPLYPMCPVPHSISSHRVVAHGLMIGSATDLHFVLCHAPERGHVCLGPLAYHRGFSCLTGCEPAIRYLDHPLRHRDSRRPQEARRDGPYHRTKDVRNVLRSPTRLGGYQVGHRPPDELEDDPNDQMT